MKIKTNIPSIMHSTSDELKEICGRFLTRFDDFQQIAGNNKKFEMIQYFADSYDKLEEFFFQLKEGLFLESSRNRLRMLIKETEKMASLLINPIKTFSN